MKYGFYGLCLGALLFSANASAELSCVDLEDVADALDDVADELAEMRSVREDGRVDRDLADITEALTYIADEEEDRRMDNAVSAMIEGWEEYDLGLFEEGLEDVIDRLDDLYDRDC